jgi:hypothetical protein
MAAVYTTRSISSVILDAFCPMLMVIPFSERELVREDALASEPDTRKPFEKRISARPLILMPPIPIK